MKLGAAIVLAALSGFVALSYEILWIRLFSFITWGGAWSFGLLLGAYLAGIAVGAAGARRFCRQQDRVELRMLALFLLLANLVGFLLIPGVAELVTHVSAYWTLAVVGVASALLGTGLPLIAHFGISADAEVGARLSYVYLGNIIGSTAGSLLTGLLFLDWWSLSVISVLLLGVGFALAAGVTALSDVTRARRLQFALLVAAAAVVAAVAAPRLFDGVYEKLQLRRDYKAGFRFKTVIEGRSGVVTVTPDGVVSGDGVYDGRFDTSPVSNSNGIVRAYAISALHPGPKDILVVGLGSGSWTQVLAHHPTVERLVVVEINPGYVELLETSPVVSSVVKNPKVEIVIDDGRRWITRTDRTFDVIVQNTTYHFRSHATNLLSREYFAICRGRLKPGGIMMYNTTWSKEAAATGLDLFPHAFMIANNMVVADRPLHVDRYRWRRTMADYRIDGKPVIDIGERWQREVLDKIVFRPPVTDPSVLGPERHPKAWVSRKTLLAWTRGARVITDDNMASEWSRWPR